MTPDPRSDRYDPLPGITELPGFLLRKLGPRGRRIAAVLAGAFVLALAAGIVFGMPAITESKEERAAAQQRSVEERKRERVAQLRAEMRVRTGTGTAARGLEGGAAITARQALAADLAAAVKADAVGRVEGGELSQTVDRVECERFPRGARGEDPATDLGSATGRYSCLAITADAPRIETNESSSIGYPYRALVDFPAGSFAFCKISGRAGEGGLTADIIAVAVPPECGGTGG